jgi:hypothetical protein
MRSVRCLLPLIPKLYRNGELLGISRRLDVLAFARRSPESPLKPPHRLWGQSSGTLYTTHLERTNTESSWGVRCHKRESCGAGGAIPVKTPACPRLPACPKFKAIFNRRILIHWTTASNDYTATGYFPKAIGHRRINQRSGATTIRTRKVDSIGGRWGRQINDRGRTRRDNIRF